MLLTLLFRWLQQLTLSLQNRRKLLLHLLES